MLEGWQVQTFARELESASGTYERQRAGIKTISPSILAWAGRTSATLSADTKILRSGHWKFLRLASK
jgi:hypothetical protein